MGGQTVNTRIFVTENHVIYVNFGAPRHQELPVVSKSLGPELSRGRPLFEAGIVLELKLLMTIEISSTE